MLSRASASGSPSAASRSDATLGAGGRSAAAIDRYTRAPDVPLWARQMEVFILEDMNELDAARILLGGMLASGNIKDPQEAQFLARHLKELEQQRSGAR